MKKQTSELRKLAEFIHQLTWEEIPEDVRSAAKDRVLDLVSVGAGAAEDPLIRSVAESYGQRSGAVSDGCLNPKNTLDAKFSLPYSIAAALIYGKVTMEEFTPERLAEPQMQELLKKIRVREEARFTEQYPKHWGAGREDEIIRNIRTLDTLDRMPRC